MSDLPEPLTPADCDLRDFSFMPVDIIRLFGSRFHAVATDAEWRAGLTLWLKSFHQVPASSVPDDDVELARLAELGRDVRAWKKIRAGALHGWVKCSDGRLYHPVVAEKAAEAWSKKEFYRERSRKANAKRWNGLDKSDEHAPLQAEQGDVEVRSRGNGEGSTEGFQKASLKDQSRTPSASQGTGTVRVNSPPTPKPVTPQSEHQSMCQRVADEAGMLGIPPDHRLLREWLALPDMEFERDILPIVRRVAAEVKAGDGRAPFKFKLFDAAIREQQAKDAGEIERLRASRARMQAESPQPQAATH